MGRLPDWDGRIVGLNWRIAGSDWPDRRIGLPAGLDGAGAHPTQSSPSPIPISNPKSAMRENPDPQSSILNPQWRHGEIGRAYFAVITNCPRRFAWKQVSVSSMHVGCSSPLLTMPVSYTHLTLPTNREV